MRRPIVWRACKCRLFKIGSGECNNYPLLKHVAAFGKPIILSTGMNTIESVGKAVDIFESYRIPYALLHTTNLYPTPPHLVRLGAMVELAQAFPGQLWGCRTIQPTILHALALSPWVPALSNGTLRIAWIEKGRILCARWIRKNVVN